MIDLPDSTAVFYLFDGDDTENVLPERREMHLQALLGPEKHTSRRYDSAREEWVQDCQSRLDNLAMLRISHVGEWLNSNTARFSQDLPQLQEVQRLFDLLSAALKANIKLCGVQCSRCHLACVSSCHHSGPHDCLTSHSCPHPCGYSEAHADTVHQMCGLPYVQSQSLYCLSVDLVVCDSAGHAKAHMYVLLFDFIV